MRHGSLFSGIGGFDLAAEWMGWENVFHCEWNPFGQKVLHHYWPNAMQYNDITKTDFSIHRGSIDILTGGFPCQPYSTAGKRLGKEDERHLWPEMLRAIREIQPRWVVGENVRGLVSWNGGMVFDEVQADLEAEGFEIVPLLLPACGVNAPHRRDRIWFVAHRSSDRRLGGWQGTEDEKGLQERPEQDGKLEGGLEGFRSNGSSPNSHHTGGGDGSGQVQGKDGEVPQWDNHAEPGHAGAGDVSHSQRTRLEGGFGSSGAEGFKPGCGEDDATNTGSIELQRGMHKNGAGEAERYFGSCNPRINGGATWDNFPTEPPVRGRYDGISPELVGITVSKHRQESIKGYGNAVVPQLVHQIFQAIDQYKKL